MCLTARFRVAMLWLGVFLCPLSVSLLFCAIV
ncbi:hypothetical protein LOK49_LG13G00848 [Camellia lanceoleosa]|uniref:Uncharacterized protein n=1 Tax=Camellia lanceoleosa TaxID=1840588 RepID=A0ACC0FK67_9ERIC|nr:hypothetical protein LOK49_LG13G00848 [Camellia lanceoleosa]